MNHVIAFVEHETIELAQFALELHDPKGDPNQLTILVKPAEPPTDGVRLDGEINSFVAYGPWVEEIAKRSIAPRQLCYHFLRHALSEAITPRIRILHRKDFGQNSIATASVESIIPHRGQSKHLKKCLSGITSQETQCKVTVCVDQEVDAEIRNLLTREFQVDAFAVIDAPRGPYVLRQHFAMRTQCDYMLFQDSDDFSISTRASELIRHAVDTNADIVGCHELRLDEIDHVVRAIRFPLDVNMALSRVAAHPQLFPTTAVRSEFFRRHGGLSTIRKFGSDTEYLLRSHFFAKIVNLDQFLYIRRRRKGSLTTNPLTALGSPVRLELDRAWKSDFAAVKEGRMHLSESSIALRHHSTPPQLERIAGQ